MWSARHTCCLGIAAAGLLLPPTGASAERVYYEVNGHQYWYNPNSKRGRERAAQELAAKEFAAREAAEAAQRAQQEETPFRKFMNFFGASTERASQQAVTAQSEERLDARRTARPDRESERVKASRRLEEAGQLATGTLAPTVKTNAPAASVAARSPDANREASESTDLVTPVAWAAFLLPPPGPTVIKTITYDFVAGVKHVRLTDGTMYEEAFDPKAFYKGRVQGPYEP
jgi:hypothetical protein